MMPWAWPTAQPFSTPRGTRVWRCYLRGGRSFTFGIHFERDEKSAAEHAAQWGEVIRVEPVT